MVFWSVSSVLGEFWGGGSPTFQGDEAAPDLGVSEQPANQRQRGAAAAQLQLQLGEAGRQQDVEGRQEVVVAAVVHKGTRLEGGREGSGQLIGRRSPPPPPQGSLTSGWMWAWPGEALSR